MNQDYYIPSSSLIERIGHWTLACSSTVLLLSGKAMSLYFCRKWQMLFGGNGGTRTVHHFVAIFFIFSLIISFLAWIKDCWLTREDFEWLSKGKIFFHLFDPPSGGRFSTPQKLFFFGVMGMGLLSTLSGLTLRPISYISQGVLGWSYVVHTLSAAFFCCTSILHVYVRVVIHPGALSGITLGRVTRTWARLYKAKWLEKKEKKQQYY